MLFDPVGDFEVFWKAYPRKDAKKDARKAWEQIAHLLSDMDIVLEAIAWQLQRGCLRKPGFEPYAASWLRGLRWQDTPPRRPGKAPGPDEPAHWREECSRRHEGTCPDWRSCELRKMVEYRQAHPERFQNQGGDA